jgi:beta-1,4-mannosyl-glycoprotein beta-1,4-N-acetylglucosaminyltransferase
MIYFRQLFLICLFAWLPGHSQVYDCFKFFNEIELLKMRLEELDSVVDHFVIVESIETQRGDPKPLYFQENRECFSKYLDKIIHIVVNERHPEMDLWEREHFQRNCITRGLQHCHESDLIIISDLDEIPRPHLIRSLLQTLPEQNAQLLKEGTGKKFKSRTHSLSKKGDRPRKAEKRFYLDGARALEMSIYFYQLNRRPPHQQEGEWVGSVITTYGILNKFTPQHFREYRWKFPKIDQGGWHFTWMGGREKIRKKMESVVEGQSDTSHISDEQIDRQIAEYSIVPIDNSFPNYVLNNLDYLKSIGFIASAP